MRKEFCDAAWRRSLTKLRRRGAALDSLPYAARYGTLREAGLLPLYYRALQDEVAERAGTLRDRILRQRRDVYFAPLAENAVPERTGPLRSEEHTSELQSRGHLVCRLLLEKKKRRA